MQLSSNGAGAGNSRDIAELLKGHGSFLSVCFFYPTAEPPNCLLYTSDAADEEDSVDLGGRRIVKKKKQNKEKKKRK